MIAIEIHRKFIAINGYFLFGNISQYKYRSLLFIESQKK